MTSEKKIQANRQNALKSTGPRTPEGKEAIRLNALRHGILSKEILLPGEDEGALRELGENLRAELEPVGVLENLLVDQIVAAYWRLRRLGRVEVGIFIHELYGEMAERAHKEARSYTREEGGYMGDIDSLLPTTKITDEKKHREALSRAQEMEALRGSETATLGQTFIQDAGSANAFSKLSRYETAIDRQLHRTLHELQRLQATRRGAAVALPHVLDIDVSGMAEEPGE